MADSDTITLTILKSIQATQADILKEVHHLRDDTNLQFAALNEKLSGTLGPNNRVTTNAIQTLK